jgi:hypothetical protein
VNNLIEKLQKYLGETLSLEVSAHLWKDQSKLPFFLLDSYDFFEIFLLNHPCLLMVAKGENEPTPSGIQKHWEQIMKKQKTPCIYVSNTISSYNRKRLIQHHIPFIIPMNQLYLPDLGFDLREYFKQQRIHKKLFSPSAQTAIIFALRKEKNEKLIPSELAKELGYSLMTMTRAFNELAVNGIGKIINKGKERWWIFEETKRNLWEQTKGMLRSPIRRRESMKLFPGARMPKTVFRSGLSALAELTMINPPPVPVFAMGKEDYLKIEPKGLMYVPPGDDPDLELEIWNYDPKLFSEHERVDPFSLYLSLRETGDERIEAALEELMEKIKW